MTGELFSLLSEQSVLRHSVNSTQWDNRVVLESALKAVAAPEKIMADLFSIRASTLLHDTNPTTARSSLSGMLIGYDIGVNRHYWRADEVVLIGTPTLSAIYRSVLLAVDVNVDTLDANDATVSGLSQLANVYLRN